AANFGEKMRVRGLQGGITGVPAGAMFEEILTPGDGQIKVLFNFGGNPLMAVPDTDLAHKALSSLDLYVTTDVSMSNNARMADYVIAIKMGLEAPTTSYITEAMGYMHRGMGLDDPFAQYAPAAVDPPAGSDVIEEWQFYYRLAKALGMKLFIANSCGVPGNFDVEPIEHPLNMEVEPTTDEILELMCADARISWDELTAQRHGHVWEDLKMTVGPREPDCDQHLEVGEPVMMEYLEHHHAAGRTGAAPTPEYPFVFIGRRLKHVVNGTGQEIERLRREGTYNPVFMNPTDMAALQLTDGQGVEVRSAHGAIQGFVQRDDGLRTGVVSISHAFGRNPEDPPDPRNFGANTNQLLSLTAEYDPITGMPRMGAVPVAITRVDALAGAGHH
ncbi:MAG: molybdopterin-dependent oxidoreductase, partial [Acidimicrobiaceae bacterium]|nr:molybdopterin-dependent oxidoreductase [Acidimicrobiaceae bacterium]